MKRVNFNKAATNHEYFDAILLAYKRSNKACEAITRCGYIFSKKNCIDTKGSLDFNAVKCIERAVAQIKYLDAAFGEKLFDRYMKLDSVEDCILCIVEFNSMMLQAMVEIEAV